MASIVKRILIVKFGAIGDCIMVVPAAYRFHQQGYEVYWACGTAVRTLLESYDWINVIPVDDRTILRGGLAVRIAGMLRFWRQVAGRSYTLCATLYYDRRYRLLVWPIRAGKKIVLSRKARAFRLLPGRHHTNEYVRVLLQADDTCRDHSTAPVPPTDLPPAPWPPCRAPRRIAIFPGGTGNLLRNQTLRRWPIERYVGMTQLFLDRGWEVAVLGGAEDAWVRPHFEHLNIMDGIGAFNLPEVVSACNASDAVVTHDTGPLHLAGLSGACLLGIFGPTDPAMFLPQRPYVNGLWGGRGFACRPCYDGRDFAPCQHNGCMHQVTVADALAELDRLLEERDQGLETPWRVVEPKIDSIVSIQPAHP